MRYLKEKRFLSLHFWMSALFLLRVITIAVKIFLGIFRMCFKMMEKKQQPHDPY